MVECNAEETAGSVYIAYQAISFGQYIVMKLQCTSLYSAIYIHVYSIYVHLYFTAVLGSYETTPCRRVLATAVRAPLSLSISHFSFSFPVGFLETMTEPALHPQVLSECLALWGERAEQVMSCMGRTI